MPVTKSSRNRRLQLVYDVEPEWLETTGCPILDLLKWWKQSFLVLAYLQAPNSQSQPQITMLVVYHLNANSTDHLLINFNYPCSGHATNNGVDFMVYPKTLHINAAKQLEP